MPTDDQHDGERDRDLRREARLEVERADPEQRERGDATTSTIVADGDEEVVHEEVGEVGEQPAAEHPLRPEREQLLQRHEEEEQHARSRHGAVAAHDDREDERGKERQPGDDPDLGRAVRISCVVHGRLGFGSLRSNPRSVSWTRPRCESFVKRDDSRHEAWSAGSRSVAAQEMKLLL